MKRLLLLCPWLVAAHCNTGIPAVPSCSTACENQRELGCILGEPTAEGSSCEDVCKNAEAIPGLSWDVVDLTEIKTCK